MSEWTLLGDYCKGIFSLPSKMGRNACDGIFEHFCPANTRIKLWEVPFSSHQIPAMVESAMEIKKTWEKESVETKKSYLEFFLQKLLPKKEELVRALTLETGRPLWNTRLEIEKILTELPLLFARIEQKLQEYTEESWTIGHNPVGLCALFGSSDMPLYHLCQALTHLILCGNRVIYTPHPSNLYSSEIIFMTLHEANFPPGVLSLLHGDKECHRRILQEKLVQGVYFLGDMEYAQEMIKVIPQQHTKMISLSAEGKNTALIAPGTYGEREIQAMVESCYYSQGQTRNATNIFLIEESIHEEFIKKFHEGAKKLIVDHPLESQQTPFLGSLLDQKSQDHYLTIMGIAQREGAQELMRGKKIKDELQGYYVSPSIHLGHQDQDASFGHYFQEPIWGPNAYFIVFSDYEKAMEILNKVPYGQSCSIYTPDPILFQNLWGQLDYGRIHWNNSALEDSSLMPKMYRKNSGNLRGSGLDFFENCCLKKILVKKSGGLA